MFQVKLVLGHRGSAWLIRSNIYSLPPLRAQTRCVQRTGYVGHIFAHISGCSLWNLNANSPLAHRKQSHDTTISALSWLYNFYILAFVGKGYVHVSACGVWCVNIQGADQKRNHEATVQAFSQLYISFWCTAQVVDKRDVHISAHNIVIRYYAQKVKCARKIQSWWNHVQSPTELWEKKNVSIYRRRLSMIEKLRTFFFP